MGYRRINGIFAYITLNAVIVILLTIRRQRPALNLHFMCRLPGPDDDFTHPPHSLGIGGQHRKGAQIMQNIFSRNGFPTNAAFGKRNIFGNTGVKMVAHHQHIQMLINCIHGIGPGRIG